MILSQGVPNPTTHIGQKLHEIRKQRGLRLTDVARGIVSVGYLSMIEQGQRTPSPQVLSALAARLDVDQAVLEAGSFASARLTDVIEIQEALWHHLIGDYSEAIRRYRQVLKRGSTVAGEATRGISRSLLRAGEPQEALHMVRRRAAALFTVGDWATEAGNSLTAGLCLLQLGDLSAAHESLQHAADITGLHAPGSDMHLSSLVYLGRCQLRRGLVSAANSSFQSFLSDFSSLRPMHTLATTASHWWVQAFEQIGSHDLVGAIRTRERALALRSLVATADVKLRMAVECVGYLVRARSSESLAMAAQAAHQLRTVQMSDVDPRVRSNLLLVSAEVALAMHAPHDALEFVDEAVSVVPSPDLAWASMIRALAYETLADLEAARENADEARARVGSVTEFSRSSDEVTEPWEVLAAFYRRLGDDDTAWECMRLAVAGAGINSSYFPAARMADRSELTPTKEQTHAQPVR